MSAEKITNANFKSQVLENEKKVLLDFWAPWCGPCRMLGPVIEEIADERPDVMVGKVNVDEELELAARFGVSSIPTVVIMQNGEIVQRLVGARPKAQILGLL